MWKSNVGFKTVASGCVLHKQQSPRNERQINRRLVCFDFIFLAWIIECYCEFWRRKRQDQGFHGLYETGGGKVHGVHLDNVHVVLFPKSPWSASGGKSEGPVQFSSVAQACPTLCDPMNRSTPGLPVHHHLLEFTQTHVHRVRDAIQPSHPR